MQSIRVNDIEFRQCSIAPRVWISSDGKYILPDHNLKIREGSELKNKKGYPTQKALCTKVTVNNSSVYKVFNIGRLVLDAWAGQVMPDMEVDHIDLNPYNNELSNIQFVTKQQNLAKRRKFHNTWSKSYYAKMTPEEREELSKKIKEGQIRAAKEAGFETIGEFLSSRLSDKGKKSA